MSEERQTRLLPFRLRRAAARTPAPPREEDTAEDLELRELLRAWQAPEPSLASRARLVEGFRAGGARPALWRRLLTARLSVPVPVAASLVFALALGAVALVARAKATGGHEASGAGRAAEVRVVEVPVPFERVVTRVVYVPEKETPRQSPRTAPRPAAKDEAKGDDAATSYFTGVDMAEFRPAEQMQIRVINRREDGEQPEQEGKQSEQERKGR